MNRTEDRKSEHLIISLKDEILFEKSAGFERYEFNHFASSELIEEEVDVKADFFGREIDYPFLISCMIGGTTEAENINMRLAEIAEELNIPIGVGSQRVMLENKSAASSFASVRKKAPSIPILGNIGAAEFVKFKDETPILRMSEIIEADAFVIHLNLLQEMIQPEGNPNFKGLLNKIEKLKLKLDIPLIAKEVGFGITKESAATLLNAGIDGIDTAGAGGTSWSKIESKRGGNSVDYWDEWGMPTAYCIKSVAELKNENEFLLIGSGGIDDPTALAKSLALGADIGASARKVLKKLIEDGAEALTEMLTEWFSALKKIMVLTNSNNIIELRGKLIKKEDLY